MLIGGITIILAFQLVHSFSCLMYNFYQLHSEGSTASLWVWTSWEGSKMPFSVRQLQIS